MGRKPGPTNFRWHKFKNPESLLTRINERVAGGVFERPQWYDAYQRDPIDIKDMSKHVLTSGTRELLKEQREARIPRPHPAQALLDRMFDRRPSFTAAVFDEAEPNITQKYFNRMYELLEDGTPEKKAFSDCDSEFKVELIEYEKSLTSRVISKEAQFGSDVAHRVLAEAIAVDEGKRFGNETPFSPNGFSLGRGVFYEPLPFDKDDIHEYEKEVSTWYDRSKFSWAHDWEGQISRILRMGLTEKEMRKISSEMRFALENPAKSTDTGEGKAFKLGLGIRIYDNRETPTENRLSLEHHRKLCHLCLYLKEAQRRLAETLKNITPGDPPARTLEIVSRNLRKDARILEKLNKAGIIASMRHKLDDLKEAEGDNYNNTTREEATNMEARARVLMFLEKCLEEEAYVNDPEVDLEETDLSMIRTAFKEACGLEPLPEEKSLREFLENTLNRPDLCDFESKGTFDAEEIRELQRMPVAMVPVVSYAEEIIEDLEHLHAQGDPPQSGRVRRCFMNLQRVQTFTEEVQMHQHGKIFTIDDVLEARDLYRATITPGYNPTGKEKLMLSDIWDEIELIERYQLLNQTIQPTLTISQFNRIESDAFLSRLVPMQDPLPYLEEEDQTIDWLYEVGFGRLSNPDIQEAIMLNRIFPARIRSYIFRQGRPVKKLRPFLNHNKDLEIQVAQDEEDSVKYSAHGGKDKVDAMVNEEVYKAVEEVTVRMANAKKLEAQWQAAEQRFNKETSSQQ